MSRSTSESLLFGGARAPLTGWALVVAEGRDAVRFLHSQLTSDVQGLGPEESQPTALLDRGGRLQAFGFLYRRTDRVEILLPTEIAAATVRRLEDNVISDDVTLTIVDTPRLHLALGAEAVRRVAEDGDQSRFPIAIYGSRGFVTWGDGDLDLPIIGGDQLEPRRVLTGLPRWGDEVTEGVLIHETALIDTAVSKDKGCYLGQETVAKVMSGRGAARAPMLLEVISGDPIGSELVGKYFASDVAKKSGTVLSSTRWEDRDFLQAMLVRELRVQDREIECRFEDGPKLTVRVHSLPFLSSPQLEAWARRIELQAVKEFAADREEEAIELYERAIAVCPSYADAYEALGVILGRHGRYEEAIELMQRLLEVDPLSVMAHTNLSLYYNQQGRIEDAEREAAEAMRAKMRCERDEKELAEAAQDQTASAIADRERRAAMFRQVLDLDPDDALGNFGLGELLVEEGRFAEAITHLERALMADPRYSAALLALGRAHEGAEDLSSACETYRRGVDVAAARGDLATANKMQERLAVLDAATTLE
ncbi:MAG: tetratricopeptide repeat protein [Acidobacteria bacterium]|nr:tetratricopeptide repeat protein [Candidatus Sulfomarinibacter kjeldsenii]